MSKKEKVELLKQKLLDLDLEIEGSDEAICSYINSCEQFLKRANWNIDPLDFVANKCMLYHDLGIPL